MATLGGQPVQSRAAFFQGVLRHLYVDDRDDPYTTPPDAPFVWIRGRQAGGRTHTFGQVLLRWTDDDFRGLPPSGGPGSVLERPTDDQLPESGPLGGPFRSSTGARSKMAAPQAVPVAKLVRSLKSLGLGQTMSDAG